MAPSPLRPWVLPLALALIAAGCTTPRVPASGLSVPNARRSASPTPAAARVTSPTPAPSNSPATPRPTATPRLTVTTQPVRPGPSVQPSLESPPELAALPVALNTAGSIGLAAETENYLVLSAANLAPGSSWSVAATDGSLAYRLSGAPTSAPAPRRVDAHRALRRLLAAQVPPPETRRASYGLRQAPRSVKVGDTQDLWVISRFDGADVKEVRVRAEVVEVGARCYVLVDQAALGRTWDREALGLKASEIASTFDTVIHPTNTRLFGSEPQPGVDGDPRVFILLSPAVGDYGRDTTLGYFSQRDAFAADARVSGPAARSNAREILYISSDIVLKGDPEDYMGTIAHEFQHMINFNQKVLLGKGSTPEELWIDEGMSMYAIEACGYGLRAGGAVLANHVRQYQKEPEAYSLSDWDGNPEGIGYGPVYLLTVYLADRFGEAFIKEVTTAKAVGAKNLQTQLEARDSSLTAVLHDWALANLLDPAEQVTDPRYQYKMLDMRGPNGSTRLQGFRVLPLNLPEQIRVPGRPLSVRYYRMEDGAIAPRFSITGGGSDVKTRAYPRLVLPEAGF